MTSSSVAPDFAQACEYLQQARKFGLKLGLESMEGLARALGNPHQSLRFIHIAGTNGKGSTAAFCASILQSAGLRVGLYTSPHLCSIRERLQINGAMITADEFAMGMALIQRLAAEHLLNPTFFEILTALALWHFQRQRVEWVIWETGLGGRLDATNIVSPQITIISNIALDHGQYLGETLAEIAAEKAGIIKPGVPVVTAVSAPEPLRVIEEVARKQGAPLIRIGSDLPVEIRSSHLHELQVRIDGQSFSLTLPGAYQAFNAACAYAACRRLRVNGQALSLPVIRQGLAQARWPGRFQLLRESPPWVIDGAHNPDAVAMLIKSWRGVFGDRPYHLVFGVLADKPFADMAQQLKALASRVSLVKVLSERAVCPELLVSAFEGLPTEVYPSLQDVWQQLQSESAPVLITGSLFLVGQSLCLARPGEYLVEDLALNERL